MAELASGGRFDDVHDLAIPLPVTIIAEMLGVERERLADFKRWSDVIISAMTGPLRGFPPHPEAIEVFLELDEYLARVIRPRRREPGDDLVSALGGVVLRDVAIPQGATVAVMLGSANRDERRFLEPDPFDPDRDTRGHLGFGFGQHFCLGASLARLDLRPEGAAA